MDQNQRRAGIKTINKIRNILKDTAIETEPSNLIEKHLSTLEDLLNLKTEIETKKWNLEKPAQAGIKNASNQP